MIGQRNIANERPLPAVAGAGTFAVADSTQWHNSYWLIAALPAMLLFGSDGLEILMYDHARAPNAGVVGQLTLMLAFYAAWPVVPWLVWKAIDGFALKPADPIDLKAMMGKLAFLGVGANLLHMMLLAVVLRVLYSPPGWGALHLLDSVVELWIQHAGLWYFVYVAFCVGIYYFLLKSGKQKKDTSPVVYKIRSGNRIIPVNMTAVSWVEACGNYAQLHTEQGVFLVRKSLATIERETVNHAIVRSHRGALVNVNFVSAIRRDSKSGQYCVELHSGDTAPLSRRRLAAFKSQVATP